MRARVLINVEPHVALPEMLQQLLVLILVKSPIDLNIWMRPRLDPERHQNKVKRSEKEWKEVKIITRHRRSL